MGDYSYNYTYNFSSIESISSDGGRFAIFLNEIRHYDGVHAGQFTLQNYKYTFVSTSNFPVDEILSLSQLNHDLDKDPKINKITDAYFIV